MKVIIAIAFGMLLGAAIALCLLRSGSMERGGFADRQKEHEEILAEAVAAKEAA